MDIKQYLEQQFVNYNSKIVAPIIKAIKEQIAKLVTKDDLKDYAKKSDLKNLDLTDYVQKKDIKELDLSAYVTKDELDEVEVDADDINFTSDNWQ